MLECSIPKNAAYIWPHWIKFIISTAFAWEQRNTYSLKPCFCCIFTEQPYKPYSSNLFTILHYMDIRKDKAFSRMIVVSVVWITLMHPSAKWFFGSARLSPGTGTWTNLISLSRSHFWNDSTHSNMLLSQVESKWYGAHSILECQLGQHRLFFSHDYMFGSLKFQQWS